MKAVRVALFAGALFVAGEPLAARAITFPALPPIFPDICASLAGCDITFTQSSLLQQVQHYFAMVQNFSNIRNIAGAQGMIQQVVGMVRVAKAAPPQEQGDAAAEQVLDTTDDTQTRIAAIDAQAQTADGVQEQSQVHALYESTIAGNTAQTNALISAQQQQQKARDDDAIDSIVKEAGPDSAAADGSEL